MADDTKPLPEPVLPNNQLGPVTFAWVRFHCKYLCYPWCKFENYSFQISVTSPRGQWVKKRPLLSKELILYRLNCSGVLQIDGLVQTAVTPLLTHWSYCNLVLSHQNLFAFSLPFLDTDMAQVVEIHPHVRHGAFQKHLWACKSRSS